MPRAESLAVCLDRGLGGHQHQVRGRVALLIEPKLVLHVTLLSVDDLAEILDLTLLVTQFSKFLD